MLGVIFILLATALIYVFIGGTAVAGGKAVYNASKSYQEKNKVADPNPQKIREYPVLIAQDPSNIKELQQKGGKITSKQADILAREEQARESYATQFNKFEYHVATETCLPVIDSVEKLREFNAEKAKKAGVNTVERPTM